MKITIAFILLIAFGGCRTSSTEDDVPLIANEHLPEKINVVIDPLPDSHFLLRDISDSYIWREIEHGKRGWYLLNDTSHALLELDEAQLRTLVAECPGINKDKEWVMGDWKAAFVSKQQSIRDLTPITIVVRGTDYSALLLIILDRSYNPVNYIELTGGECGGDFCGIKHSILTGDSVNTYEITPVPLDIDTCTMAAWGTVTVDSVVIYRRILSSGEFQTSKQMRSTYCRSFNTYN